ncbi:MAG: TonB-dependent receptor, partial [Terriglobales bacterium]
YQIQDAVSLNKGTHTFKLGVDISLLEINDGIPFNSAGLITYNGGGDCSAIGLTTCTALANFVDDFSGPAGQIRKQFGNPRVNVPTNVQAYYFQDSWKVRPNLTLNYGLRYEYHPPDYSNVLSFPAVRRETALTDPFNQRFPVERDRNNFAPRFGFSYTPRFWNGLFGDGKTVFRGGWGVYYDAFFTNISNNTAAASPNTLGGTITGAAGTRGTASAFTALGGITAAANPLNTVTSIDSKLVNPLTHQWNLNVQRELPGKFIAEIAYVGTRGQRLYVNEQLNPRDPATGLRLNPARGSIVIRGNRGDSIYHGLQSSVRRSYGRLFLLGSYTWSRSIDNMSEVFVTSGAASRWQDVMDPRSDRGPSVFHRTHRGVITWVYDLPYPKANDGPMKVLSWLARDWSTSGQISFQSGSPETVFAAGFDQNLDGEAFNDRPSVGNLNAPINLSDDCTNNVPIGCITGIGFDDGLSITDLWNGNPGTANDFRYILNDLGLNGNVGRNSIYNRGRQDYNLSVIRRIKFAERHQLEFRADFLNAFNHPNLGGGPVASVSGDTFFDPLFLNNEVTRFGGRSIRLWLKYQF